MARADYRARDDEPLERDVAVKVLPAGLLTDEAARKRFRKEARALAKLNHPNIATVYDVGEQDGLDYLVLEYVQGHNLNTAGLTPTSENSTSARWLKTPCELCRGKLGADSVGNRAHGNQREITGHCVFDRGGEQGLEIWRNCPVVG